MYDVVLIVVGFGLVAKGGDLFVDSRIHSGHVLRVPRFVIGGTLVSLATTTPELVVSAMASSVGDSGIALGNAIGSCICNIGLIIGTVALLTPVEVEKRDFVRRVAWMASSAMLVVAFTWDRTLSRPLAAVLLALAFVYLVWDYLGIRRQRAVVVEGEAQDTSGLTKAVVLFAVGAVLIVVGSRLLVDSGGALAVALGVPSIVIGLTVVAIGTSLPELVTGVSAAREGRPGPVTRQHHRRQYSQPLPGHRAVGHDQPADARPFPPSSILTVGSRCSSPRSSAWPRPVTSTAAPACSGSGSTSSMLPDSSSSR